VGLGSGLNRVLTPGSRAVAFFRPFIIIFLMVGGGTGTCHENENYRREDKNRSHEFHSAKITIVQFTIGRFTNPD
jgi:hypothetical protein